MLISYQKCGEFEFRTPSVEYTFEGDMGRHAAAYLDHCRTDLNNAHKTLDIKRLYLYDFSKYMDDAGMAFSDLSVDAIEGFFKFIKDMDVQAQWFECYPPFPSVCL